MKEIKKPGIYELSNEEYHDQEALGKSGLMQLAKSPAHYMEWYQAPEEKPTKAMVLGTATHKATSRHTPNLALPTRNRKKANTCVANSRATMGSAGRGFVPMLKPIQKPAHR